MKLGIDLIDKHLDFFKGKRVGLITNPTGINSNYISTIDVLNEKVNLVALFSPEHGIRGDIQAGKKLDTYTDPKTNITVYSLYGDTRRPTKEMLDAVDVIAIDIQDVGARFYTYIYTMAYAMEAASEAGIEFVVFDRPNPVGGEVVEGNILDLDYRSFIGYYELVQRHGLTIGELALLFNQEYKIGAKLKVIPMEGWHRNMYYDDTKLLWIMPSPNLPTPTSTILYLATCIFEGTNISEGRGTTAPFHIVGAPFINADELSNKLNELALGGVYFRAMYFVPTFSKHKDELCGGVEVHLLSKDSFNAVKVGWAMLDVIRRLYKNEFVIRDPYVKDRPCMLEFNTGTNFIKDDLYTLEEQFKIIDNDTEKFKKIRKKYLIY